MPRVAALLLAQGGVFVGAVEALCLSVARLEALEAPAVLAPERALRATASGRTIFQVSENALSDTVCIHDCTDTFILF